MANMDQWHSPHFHPKRARAYVNDYPETDRRAHGHMPNHNLVGVFTSLSSPKRLGWDLCLVKLLGIDMVNTSASLSFSAEIWSKRLPHRVLDRDLVGTSALLSCSTKTWSAPPPRWVAWQRPDRNLCLAELLGRDLVGTSASLSCSAGTWSGPPPCWVARQGFHRDLLPRWVGRDLVGKWAVESLEPTLGT